VRLKRCSIKLEGVEAMKKVIIALVLLLCVAIALGFLCNCSGGCGGEKGVGKESSGKTKGAVTIYGTISYTGAQASSAAGKAVIIALFSRSPDQGVKPDYANAVTVPESGLPSDYELKDVIPDGEYHFIAFLDLNGNGRFDGAPEPIARVGELVRISRGSRTQVNISLSDEAGR